VTGGTEDPWSGGRDEAARLVREVQDLGFETARTVVARFTELFAQFTSTSGAESSCRQSGSAATGYQGSDSTLRQLQQDAQRAADSYFAVLAQLNEASLRFLDAARPSPSPPSEETGLSLPDVRPGGRVSARVWLQNRTTTSAAARTVQPWCPGLTNHSGASLPPSAVTCTPEEIDHLESGESREVLLTVDVGRNTAPGLYHGQLLVRGLPDTVFPLRLLVVADATPP